MFFSGRCVLFQKLRKTHRFSQAFIPVDCRGGANRNTAPIGNLYTIAQSDNALSLQEKPMAFSVTAVTMGQKITDPPIECRVIFHVACDEWP